MSGILKQVRDDTMGAWWGLMMVYLSEALRGDIHYICYTIPNEPLGVFRPCEPAGEAI